MSKANLKGNVESITEFEYETVDLFGKIKRKITIPDSCVSGSQVTYDKVGNRFFLQHIILMELLSLILNIIILKEN